jgi:hypothetical protein
MDRRAVVLGVVRPGFRGGRRRDRRLSRDALAFSAGAARRNAGLLTVVYVIDAAGDGMAALVPGGAAVLGVTERQAVEAIRSEVASPVVP